MISNTFTLNDRCFSYAELEAIDTGRIFGANYPEVTKPDTVVAVIITKGTGRILIDVIAKPSEAVVDTVLVCK